MKFVLVLAAMYLATNFLYAQSTVNDYQLSTGGIGPFKIGMSKAAVEKLLNTKLTLPRSSKGNNYEMDTAKAVYKDVQLQLIFVKAYFGSDTAAKQGVYSISSSSPQVKTKSGISIGDDKLKIVKTYDQFRLEISPEWIDSKPNPNRGTVTLYDNESARVIIFYLDNNIVIKVEASQYEGE